MSIAILASILAIWKGFELRAEVDICIFTNSLMGATIQDGGMRERSDGHVPLHWPKRKVIVKEKKKKNQI